MVTGILLLSVIASVVQIVSIVIDEHSGTQNVTTGKETHCDRGRFYHSLAGNRYDRAAGPAVLVIPIGLSVLATELVWARRLLIKLKSTFQKGKEKNHARETK